MDVAFEVGSWDYKNQNKGILCSFTLLSGTEVHTSPMLASAAQLLAWLCKTLPKYITMTDVTTRLNLEESLQLHLACHSPSTFCCTM